MYPTGGKQEPWVIDPEFMSLNGFVRLRILFKEKCNLYYCPADMRKHINEQRLGSMWIDEVDSPPVRILIVALERTLHYKRTEDTGGVQEGFGGNLSGERRGADSMRLEELKVEIIEGVGSYIPKGDD